MGGMQELALAPFLGQLAFPESPRWHEGRLWYSDFHLGRVCRADKSGRVEVVTEVPGQPSGLGWLPDGRLLVVSMKQRSLLRLDEGRLAQVADLSPWAPGLCNDMLVDPQGRAYIGNFGFDMMARAPFAPTVLLLVTPQGEVRVAAEDMHFPNGTVLTPDGRTLIVAESYGQRLTAFDVGSEGELSRRRVWARFSGRVGPDGIALDAEGAVWIASPVSREVLRVREGGEVTHRIPTQDQALACALGGADGRTLYVCTGRVMVTPQESLRALGGAIWQTQVEVGAP